MTKYRGTNDLVSGEKTPFIRVRDEVFIGASYQNIIFEDALEGEMIRLRNSKRGEIDFGTITLQDYTMRIVVEGHEGTFVPNFHYNPVARGETILTLMRNQDPLHPVDFVEPSELAPVGASRERFI